MWPAVLWCCCSIHMSTQSRENAAAVYHQILWEGCILQSCCDDGEMWLYSSTVSTHPLQQEPAGRKDDICRMQSSHNITLHLHSLRSGSCDPCSKDSGQGQQPGPWSRQEMCLKCKCFMGWQFGSRWAVSCPRSGYPDFVIRTPVEDEVHRWLNCVCKLAFSYLLWEDNLFREESFIELSLKIQELPSLAVDCEGDKLLSCYLMSSYFPWDKCSPTSHLHRGFIIW